MANVIFILLLLLGGFFFFKRIRSIRRNILLGKPIDRSDNRSERWKTMTRVALGQSKMVVRPVAGLLHIIIYAGFIIINIEVLEIIIDGIFGTHRVFSPAGKIYDVLIGAFEFLALGVLVACIIFLIRRNVLNIKRFHSAEMTSWPKSDANIILIVEVLLMFAFLSMNATDALLQDYVASLQEAGQGVPGYLAHYHPAGAFPVSSALFQGLYNDLSPATLFYIERGMWWFHIAGILAFLVYIPYSKHLHIFLAFPNTYYSNLEPKGHLTNMPSVTKEVQLMMDPNADPFAAQPAGDAPAVPERFGAKDVLDLNWKQLMDSYSCTECGRCTSECPANMTGKKLSPRKIMMDTRDRLEEVGKVIDQKGEFTEDGKTLLGDFITEEELWACTTCNACVQACPVNIDPLSIIMSMRRSLIMEDSKSPEPITAMFNNVENNGAPWAFPASDRGNWINEIN